MTTLNDILSLIRMEDQWIYIFDTDGPSWQLLHSSRNIVKKPGWTLSW